MIIEDIRWIEACQFCVASSFKYSYDVSMLKQSVLVVEDDSKTASAIRLYLENAGLEVQVSPDGKEALARARSGHFDLILLDIMLPHIDGMNVCRILRKESEVPIIFLTARTREEDKLAGLEYGADDYVSKPFSPRELVARVRAILRRAQNQPKDSPNPICRDDLTMDFHSHQVRVGDQPVSLTRTEHKLLEIFLRSPQRAFTRQELVEKALGIEYDGHDRTIDTHIRNLRRKIDLDGTRDSHIATLFGVGYKLAGRDS